MISTRATGDTSVIIYSIIHCKCLLTNIWTRDPVCIYTTSLSACLYVPCREKTCLQDHRSGTTQTQLIATKDRPYLSNLRCRATVFLYNVVKTKALISRAVTEQLICTYAKSRLSHDTAHISMP